MAEIQRLGDLVLSQGTYAYIQDGSSGTVQIVNGPFKISPGDTDKPVIYDKRTRQFMAVQVQSSIQTWVVATEGQYIILENPETENNSHPSKGKQEGVKLDIGNKINIPGPTTFALWPGQIAEEVQGHQLKWNEYLLVRVYNEVAAKANIKNTVLKAADVKDDNDSKKTKKPNVIKEEELFTGNILLIKGTDVSFYIPPTGIEVLKDERGSYARNAVTLERLEYCILLDQNGDKRYERGPAVVFPKPTETFIDEKGNRIFKAVELNDNMGIYVKVIQDYQEEGKDGKQRIAGEELFITGKEQRIFFPRPELSLIKYGDREIHYAVAVPEGSGRYILDKNDGSIKLVKGNKMLLPDPRSEVIVKRILSDKQVNLWFPSNTEALNYNRELRKKSNELRDASVMGDMLFSASADFAIEEEQFANYDRRLKSRGSFQGLVGEKMQRNNEFTKPRTVEINDKYDGAVTLNVWPGFAIQKVKKTGEREVIVGPKVVMLEYDETLESLALSTNKPKTDHLLFETVYLQTENNIVSDIVEAITKDFVNVNIRLSYRVNFEGKSEKWFNVSNYVKLLTQHLRSVIRNAVKKQTIEYFNDNSTDMIRDIILGVSEKEKGRVGKVFDENGMRIYDVEVLNVTIGDKDIANLLETSQHDAVENNLKIKQKERDLNFVVNYEKLKRNEMNEVDETQKLVAEINLKRSAEKANTKLVDLNYEIEQQAKHDSIHATQLSRRKADDEQKLYLASKFTDLSIKEVTAKNQSIQPGLIDALVSIGNLENNKILAENLKAQGGGLHGIFQKGGIEGLLETVKGTPLEKTITKFFDVKVEQLESKKDQ